MKTIRYNTFETNSSSTHSATILSDEEYNNINAGKAVIKYDDYVEITEDFIKDDLKEKVINTKSCIKNHEDELFDIMPLEGKDTGDWTEDQKKSVGGWKYDTLSGSELKIKLRESIAYKKSRIETEKEELEFLESADPLRLQALFLGLIPHIEELKGSSSDDDEDEYKEEDGTSDIKSITENFTEKEVDYVKDFLDDCDNIESYGSGYDEAFLLERTIDGVTVHCMGYFGYDG